MAGLPSTFTTWVCGPDELSTIQIIIVANVEITYVSPEVMKTSTTRLCLVPPEDLVDRAIVDVFALRARLATLVRHLLCALLATARSSLKSPREPALENLALRQQLDVLRRTTKRPKLTPPTRSWNQFSAFIQEWDGLRRPARS